MKGYFKAVMVAFALIPAQPLMALTLDEAYARTLNQSEQLKISQAEIRAAEARYRQAAGGWWPEINAEGDAKFQDLETGGSSETYRAGLGATWQIFQGFRIARSAEARLIESRAEGLEYLRYRQLLYQDVADVFYQCISLAEESAIADEEIKALDNRVAELESRLKIGRSRKAELLSARTQAANQRAEATRIKNLRDASLEILSFLTGEKKEVLNPTDENPLPDSKAIAFTSEGETARFDIIAAEKRAEAARLDAKAAGGERNIGVSADGNFYVWQDPEDANEWDVMIRASLPLFDGGSRRADVGERVAQAEEQELRLSELRRIANRDIQLAADHFQSSLTQWAELQSALQSASETLALQESDYKIGRASNLDVLSALLQQFALQRRAIQTEMQVRASLVRLQVAAGDISK